MLQYAQLGVPDQPSLAPLYRRCRARLRTGAPRTCSKFDPDPRECAATPCCWPRPEKLSSTTPVTYTPNVPTPRSRSAEGRPWAERASSSTSARFDLEKAHNLFVMFSASTIRWTCEGAYTDWPGTAPSSSAAAVASAPRNRGRHGLHILFHAPCAEPELAFQETSMASSRPEAPSPPRRQRAPNNSRVPPSPLCPSQAAWPSSRAPPRRAGNGRASQAPPPGLAQRTRRAEQQLHQRCAIRFGQDHRGRACPAPFDVTEIGAGALGGPRPSADAAAATYNDRRGPTPTAAPRSCPPRPCGRCRNQRLGARPGRLGSGDPHARAAPHHDVTSIARPMRARPATRAPPPQGCAGGPRPRAGRTQPQPRQAPRPASSP